MQNILKINPLHPLRLCVRHICVNTPFRSYRALICGLQSVSRLFRNNLQVKEAFLELTQ